MPLLLEDDVGRPIPQYQNQTGTDFEAWRGADGHGNVRSDDGKIVTLGARSDSAATDHTVSASVVSILKALLREGSGSASSLSTLLDRIGEAVETPAQYTQLARLQAIIDGLAGLGTVADAVVTDPTLSATVVALLKGLLKQNNDLLDPIGDASSVIIHEHTQIHRGNGFDMDTGVLELSGDTPTYIHVVTGSKHVHLKRIDITISDNTDMYIRFYKNPTVTLDPTPQELPVANVREDSAVVSGTKFYTNSSITAVGTAIPGYEFWLPGEQLIGQSISKGGVETYWEKIFAPNTDYVIELVRETGATGSGKVQLILHWYELTIPSA